MNEPRLLIIEGPDGAGKSQLVEHLNMTLGDTVVHHHGSYVEEKRIFQHYMDSFITLRVKEAKTGKLTCRGSESIIILDRSWLSEPIYAKALNRDCRVSPAEQRMLTRAALTHGALVVVALPKFETCWRNCQGREKDAHLIIGDDPLLRDVYDGYMDLNTGLRTIWFDYEDDTDYATLDDALPLYWPQQQNAGPGAGAWRPGEVTLLVGERPGSSYLDRRWSRIPFCSDRGCAPWLADRLIESGAPEHNLYWINAFDRGGRITPHDFIEELRPQRVVALGEVAHEWCSLWFAGKEQTASYYTVRHPQFWKRFHHSEPYVLVKILKETKHVHADA